MVAVLFARSDSVYKTLPDCDVFDLDRNALSFRGGMPVVAHPPCRAWGRFRKVAKPRIGEKELALYAIQAVRQYGGVLEHPAYSSLWTAANLPLPGQIDIHRGFTFACPQFWWGHKAAKASWFYICGISPREIPPIPFRLGEPTHVVSFGQYNPFHKLQLSKADRERTPVDLARWLVELASRCRPQISAGTTPTRKPKTKTERKHESTRAL